MLKILSFIVTLVTLGAFSGLCNFHKSTQTLNLDSPHKIYRVRLKESIEQGGTKEARLEIFKYGLPFVQDFSYYRGTGLDGTFSGIYPDHRWISESALWFGRENYLNEAQDNLRVINEAHSSLRFITLTTAADSFLIIDFPSGGSIDLKASAQTDVGADISSLNCFVTRANGLTQSNSANFYIKGKYKNPAGYEITITDDVVNIRSDEFKPLKPNDNNQNQ